MPERFGRNLLLLERMAVGGMAEVFRAKHFGVEGFERLVAIKRILPSLVEDDEFIKMFIDEARIAAHLSHQNIVQIYDLGRDDELYYISMEYVSGRDLRLILDYFKKKKTAMDLGMACFIVSRICEALDFAHRKRDPSGNHLRIIHRDVSPQNVMISYEGEVKLCDFGIAKAAVQSTRTQVGVLKGKFAYMSPEQVRGRPIDRRSDLFALGVIFYEMLTTERLFLAENDYTTLENVREARVPKPRTYNPAIPVELEQIVLRMLAKTPERRYQHAAEVFEDLYAFMTSSGHLFHVRHLGRFMQEAYRREIQAENSKLEAYKDLRLPDSSGAAVEPTGDLEDPGPALVLGELSHPTADVMAEASVAALLEEAARAAGLEPEVVEGRPGEEQEPPRVDPGPGVFDGLLHEAHRSSSVVGNPKPGDDGTHDTHIFDEEMHQTIAEDAFGEEAQTFSELDPPPGDSGSGRLIEEISGARAEMLRRMDAASLDASATIDQDAASVPELEPLEVGGLKQSDADAPKTVEAPHPPNAVVEPSALDSEEDSRTEARELPVAQLGPVKPSSAPPPAKRPRSSAPPGLGKGIRSRSEAPTRPQQIFAGVLAKLDPHSLGNPKAIAILAAGAASLLVLVVVSLIVGLGPKHASLTVETTPTQAVKVFLDDLLISETTPLHRESMTLGRHVIVLEAEGFQRYRQEFVLEEPRPHSLTIPLLPAVPKPKHAEFERPTWVLEISSKPAGADVIIDGRVAGQTPMFREGLALGRPIRVRLERDGYQPVQQTIEAPERGGRRTVRVELQPKSDVPDAEASPEGDEASR